MRKGIILAGGAGSRLYPCTEVVSKHLLPVFDKPMIYYPISTLILSGISEIMIIATPRDIENYKILLLDGRQWGVNITYAVQEHPGGLAEAYLIAEQFLSGAPSTLILGDNIFFGDSLSKTFQSANENLNKATIFAQHVKDPERYGVVNFDDNLNVIDIIEKPHSPPSPFAVTGIYFLDGTAPNKAKELKPSKRGELEIVDLLKLYLRDRALECSIFSRGIAWFDTGTHASLLDASNFVRTIMEMQDLQVGSPDEAAYRMEFITSDQLRINADKSRKGTYGEFLNKLLQ